MNYKTLYSTDGEYQKIINEFQTERNELKRLAGQGLYKFESLLSKASTIYQSLSNAIHEHSSRKTNETLEVIEKLENITKSVGYAKREAEAKEFEMKYKLADDHELKNMVTDLKSDDLLEVNLLRMELKDRGMHQDDDKVRMYILENKIDGMDEIERKEYEYRKKNLATYSTVGSNTAIIDDEIIPLSLIESELWEIAKTTDSKAEHSL